MAGSLNKVQLIGNLGREPEIRTTGGGTRVATLNLATSERWRDKQSGEQKEATEWHTVVIWNDNLIKVVEKYLTKGSTIYVEGQMKTRKWSKDNVDRYSTEVVLQGFNGTLTMLGGKKKDGSDEGGGGGYGGGGGGGYGSGGGGYGQGSGRGYDEPSRGGPKESFPADLDDEIPF